MHPRISLYEPFGPDSENSGTMWPALAMKLNAATEERGDAPVKIGVVGRGLHPSHRIFYRTLPEMENITDIYRDSRDLPDNNEIINTRYRVAYLNFNAAHALMPEKHSIKSKEA